MYTSIRHTDHEGLKQCPDCRDGYVWDSYGPTEQACLTCYGYALVKPNGQPCDKAVYAVLERRRKLALIQDKIL